MRVSNKRTRFPILCNLCRVPKTKRTHFGHRTVSPIRAARNRRTPIVGRVPPRGVRWINLQFRIYVPPRETRTLPCFPGTRNETNPFTNSVRHPLRLRVFA